MTKLVTRLRTQLRTYSTSKYLDACALNNVSRTTSTSISKPALIGIIVGSVIGLIALLLLVLFIIIRIRRRRRQRADAQRLASPVFPFQNPDLEAGGGAVPSEKQLALDRSLSKLTTKSSKSARSTQSRWSQESFFSGPTDQLLVDKDDQPVMTMHTIDTGPPREKTKSPQMTPPTTRDNVE